MRSNELFRMLSRLTLAALLAAGLMSMGGERPLEASPAAQAATVSMNDDANVFDPAEITVPAGTTVTWATNPGPFVHSVTSDSGLFDSGFISNGQTFSFTFSTPGRYAYFCVPHQALGMTGVVNVQ